MSMMGATDAVAGLLALVSDPERVRQHLAEVKAATENHDRKLVDAQKAERAAAEAQKAADAKQKELDQRDAALDEMERSINQARQAAENRKAQVDQQESDLNRERSAHLERVKSDAAELAKQKLAVEVAQKALDERAAKLKAAGDALDAREAKLTELEAQVAREAAALKERAEQARKILG